MDIVERLRAARNWQRQECGGWKDVTSVYDRAPFEAADEIERLRAEVAALKTVPMKYRRMAHNAQLQVENNRLCEERDRLREFVVALFAESGWPEGGDIDQFTFQDLAHKHGILIEETRTAPCREGCWCDEYHGGEEGMRDGVKCYRKPQWLIDAALGKEER